MKVFDFNIHLPCRLSRSVDDNIANDNSMSLDDLKFCYSSYFDDFKTHISAGNFMIFNQNIFFESDMSGFIQDVKKDFPGSLFTALVDFRKKNILEYVDIVKHMGANAIKLHAYIQKITSSDFETIGTICRYAENKRLAICIDTSYGTSKMYDYDNMKLACYISDIITKVPIVLLHTGGARVIEAMLLADEKQNIFLDTSYSVLYYLGSSLESDFAYTYKKIGSKRTLYGSDTPYIDLGLSREKTLDFLQKHSFSSSEIEDIFCNTQMRLKGYDV